MGLAASWRRRGRRVAVFKKGPDYIDAAWLGFAAEFKARNLDTYMMGVEEVRDSFRRHSFDADVSLIEGNRGLFDGLDTKGTHSTAELAKLLDAPVILVLNVAKVTRTAAATVLGCLKLDPEIKIVGVVLNFVAGERHENLVRKAIEEICGLPVLGSMERISGDNLLPGRHLGLVTPAERPDTEHLNEKMADLADQCLDVGRILKIAEEAPSLEGKPTKANELTPSKTHSVRIAYFCDSAYTFYYPDNLEALESAGAKLIPVSSLQSGALPSCDGLYIGGGFPETHARQLAGNRPLLRDVLYKAKGGLPIFAECGGLIYLSRSLSYEDQTFSFAGVFDVDLQMMPRPQGHGYMEVEVDAENPYFPLHTKIRGHEFHYSRIVGGADRVRSSYSVSRGQGCFDRRDGLVFANVLASYLHIHAAGVPQWADNFVRLAKAYHNDRK